MLALKILHIIGRHKIKKTDENSIIGFFGTALTMETPLLSEVNIRDNVFILRLNNYFIIEHVEK